MFTATRPGLMDLTLHDMAQKQPRLDQTLGVVLQLDGRPPALAELRAHVAGRLDRLPALTHYLHGPGLRARWAHDPRPDLERRVGERAVAAGPDRLDAALEDLLAHPLPWDLWLLHGHAPGRYALCYRLHHSCQNGGALRHVLCTLFGAAPATAAPATAVPATAAPARPEPRAGVRVHARTLGGMLGALARNDLWNDPAHPLRNARTGTWASAPTQVLRAVGAARGGSGNDALLAALASALRTWTRAYWPRGAGRAVPAAMMVDVRRPHEADRPGNLFAHATLPLPSHRPTHEERLDAIVAATRRPKDPLVRAATRTLLDRTPACVGRAVADRVTTPPRAVVDTSHVVFPHPLSYRGDPVTGVRIATWLPRHHPASIVACSYNGTTGVYFLTDAALPGLHRLAGWWEEAVAEAHAATAPA
ncbi:wax ester/triacylglycerol synthase domain-containing protein [Streptomyces termitum]|uniref:diacylglycerol O-acyltransferase n=1 Tax=Streptomyces termitum TaxID=67368 RepID=A0A918T3K1_9ACTN|nr:wax ester/triacylglycerol synthase domain-containing protein [Streptomyces termitum]GHA82140.1 hypothetical protein GCM10010305_27380 [Streptomyces termitum]